jgi:hypothetical protein
MRLTTPILALALFAALPVTSARATDTKVCDAAYEQAQAARDAKQLTLARDQLRVCARAKCPAFMVKDCTGWLAEVEAHLPTVVLVALDAAGAVLPDVSVAVDGAATLRKLDGTAWEVDPGRHTFTFVQPDGTTVDKALVVVEGQKDQRVTVTLGAPAPVPVAPAPATPAEKPAPSAPFPYRTVGYAVGGVGVAGLIVGTIFGIEALSTKSSHCHGDGGCSPGEASTALAQGNVSTVGFVAGGVLAAGGLTLVLVAPAKKDSQATRIEAAPLVGAGPGGVSGLIVSGRW